MCMTLLLQVGLSAQNNQKIADAAPAGYQLPKTADEYVIGPEDVLLISVWMEPEITSKVTVRPDGKIGIPLLNDVQASGLTTRQLQEKITDGLKKYVSELSVSVIVVEIRSNVVYVTGSVARPGPYILGAPTTTMQSLIRAGGVTEFAKTEEIQIVRIEDNLTHRFPFHYKQFLEGKGYPQNIQLRRGDMIIVP